MKLWLGVYEALAKEQVLSSGGAALAGPNAAGWRTAGKLQSAPQQTPDHEPGRKCNRNADKRPLLDLARDVACLLPACR